ncbi:MAG: ABC transporter permease [Defluviitaleaceae bacterium]|nr:ABC transporter permease [Defluviitaleaceae bacterium]
MWKTTFRRIIMLIPQLIGVTLLIFILAEFMPGDAFSGRFVEDPTIGSEREEELRELHGLNDPWHIRYTRWVGDMLSGDFGLSLVHRRPVLEMVAERIGNTLLLSIVSIVIIYSFALPLGIIAGKNWDKPSEKIISFYNFVQMSIPTVVFAIVLQWFFGIILGILPLRGSIDVRVVNGTFFEIWGSRLQHVILPALSISLLSGVSVIRFLSNEINEQRHLDYTVTARAKGLSMDKVYRNHIFRNSMLPIAATSGSLIAGLFSGVLIIENIFTFQGMGQLFFTSVSQRDWPIVNFLVVFYSILTMAGFLISDIMLTIFDPRIRIK